VLPLKHIYHKKRLQRPKKYKYTFFDRFIYLIAFAGPVMTIPQIYDIWVTKQLAVNAVTWSGYLVIGIVWLGYGIVHKEKPIIYSNLLGIITTGLVVLGAIVNK
jgi:uncharacterized protein with PQ loop repeat